MVIIKFYQAIFSKILSNFRPNHRRAHYSLTLASLCFHLSMDAERKRLQPTNKERNSLCV